MSGQEAEAIYRLSSLPEWAHLLAYLERRLEAHRNDVEQMAPEKIGQVGAIQGKCVEVRHVMALRSRAEAILGNETRR
jgi:hypothetical protein